jgi:hypothetical protein
MGFLSIIREKCLLVKEKWPSPLDTIAVVCVIVTPSMTRLATAKCRSSRATFWYWFETAEVFAMA